MLSLRMQLSHKELFTIQPTEQSTYSKMKYLKLLLIHISKFFLNVIKFSLSQLEEHNFSVRNWTSLPFLKHILWFNIQSEGKIT